MKNMKVKYNRVSTFQQTGDRFTVDNDKYDITLLDKVSGSIPFSARPKGQEIVKMVKEGTISDLVVEELSRMGRNTGDVIKTLEWLEEHEVNVYVRNIGLQSRANGTKNPVWKMITSIMSSLYEMELENIKERTMMGRAVYIQRGGQLGRPQGSKESERKFIDKEKSQEIIKYLNKKRTVREISKITSASNKTIIKTKRIAKKYGLTTEMKYSA
jgi:DNA invertase Pin-like site-specific DNA recombinase